MNLPLIFDIRERRSVPKICHWSVMSVSHDVGLSCIQWRASSCSGMHGEGWDLRYSGQVCCDTPVRAILARRAGTAHCIVNCTCVMCMVLLTSVSGTAIISYNQSQHWYVPLSLVTVLSFSCCARLYSCDALLVASSLASNFFCKLSTCCDNSAFSFSTTHTPTVQYHPVTSIQ